MHIVTKDYFCNRCIDGNKRDYAFDCSICLFTPDTPEPTNFQARPVIVDEMVQYLTEKDKENLEWVYKISKGAAEMQKKTLTFVDNNGVTLYGDIPAEVIKKQRTENGKAEKLLKHLSDDEIAFVKANPSILENLGKQANNPLYKRATQEMQRTKSEQLVKAAEKYPEPLNPNSWTGAQLADHAFQEVFDLTSYITGMKIKFETMQDIIDDLDARYNETADDARILDNKNKMIIRQAAKWKKKYKQALAGIDKAKEDGNFVINNLMNRNTELCSQIVEVNNSLERAANNLAKQQITIENLQKQPTIAVNENFALQAEIQKMKEELEKVTKSRDIARRHRDEADEKIEGYKNRIDAYVNEIGILNNKVEQAEKIALYHQEEVKNSAEKFLKKHHDFVMLEKNFKTLETNYELKLEEITVKNEMIEQLEQRYKESVQTIDELTQHKSKLLSNATRYKKEMQDAQSKLSGYELMKEKNEELRHDLETFEKIAKVRGEEIEGLTDELEGTVEARDKYRELHQSAKCSYDTLNEKALNIRNERDELYKEKNKLQELNEQLYKDNKMMEEKTVELIEKNEQLEKQYNLIKRGHDCEEHQIIEWEDGRPVKIKCDECKLVLWREGK
jgi:uncharacterized coiled-coil DUF342 family protein